MGINTSVDYAADEYWPEPEHVIQTTAIGRSGCPKGTELDTRHHPTNVVVESDDATLQRSTCTGCGLEIHRWWDDDDPETYARWSSWMHYEEVAH